MKSFLIAAVLIALSPSFIFGQFGQNKVQYKVFDWKYIQSKHFDIYFYQGGDYIAQFTALAAESSLVKITDNVGYDIRNRIPILVFNSHNEFQQNNAVDEYMPEGVGGVTELFKNRIVVPFEGDYAKFRHVIHHEMLHAYMNDMYYGGSLQNIISQNIRLQFPGWFSEGMAEYQSLDGNDIENDMFIRDAVVYDYLPNINYIDGYLSYRGGQSFFAWLADEYGKEKIGDLMQQIKALGDVDEGFVDVYKLNSDQLSEKWHKSLKQTYWPDINLRQEMGDFANRITRKGDAYYNTAPAISPKGDKIAYISNRDDYFAVYIAEVKSGRIIKKLISGNQTADFEELHLLAPGLCWSPDSKKIVIAVKSGNKDNIFVFNVDTEDETTLPTKFEGGIFSVNWNPASNSIVFRADDSKQSDIWVYHLKQKKLERITNDVFTDIEPTWSNDGKKIYFTSDRGSYTNLSSIPKNFKMADYDYSDKDLYVFDMETKELNIFSDKKFAEESGVVSSPDGKKVLYISDRNGIKNIWRRDLETGEERPITNSLDPISLLTLSADGKRVAFNTLHKGAYEIYYIENPFEIDINMKELPYTAFMQKMLEEKGVFAKNDSLSKDSLFTVNDSLKAYDSLTVSNDSLSVNSDVTENTETRDSLNISGNPNGEKKSSLYGEDIALDLKPEYTDTVNSGKSNTNLKIKEKSKFKVTDNVNEDGSFKVNNYRIKFSPDLIYSNVNYSSFYGVQGLIQMSFSDVMGNHRVFATLSAVLDLKNSDYGFAYYYLPKRVDFGISAFHSARFLLIGNNYTTAQLYRYRTFGGDLSVSYPISKFNRLEGALAISRITKENMDNPLEAPDRLDFALPVVSYVHDNTIWGYTAPSKGTRYNITLMGSPRLAAKGISFFSAMADYRTYFELMDDYNFVFRLNAGASFGENPQRFYIGGTDSWINYEIQNDVLPVEDIQDYAFSTPIMPLRGYNINARSGSRFALMNAEFRFPLFRYLILGALPIGFQNIQGVLFTDIGTVWSNNKQLQFMKRVNGVLQTKDLLVGVGVGTRLFFMYFPIKFDVAWSYNMQHFSKPKYYISLGADF